MRSRAGSVCEAERTVGPEQGRELIPQRVVLLGLGGSHAEGAWPESAARVL